MSPDAAEYIRNQFEPGDRLAMYTDGVVETENPVQEEFGLERLSGILAGTQDADAGRLLELALSSVQAWRGETREQSDDVTLVIAEYAAARGEVLDSANFDAARA